MLVKSILNLEKFTNNFWTKNNFLKIYEKYYENMKIISLSFFFLNNANFLSKLLAKLSQFQKQFLPDFFA